MCLNYEKIINLSRQAKRFVAHFFFNLMVFKKFKMKKKIKINDDLIGMAWSDQISFEEIEKKTGFSEKEVIHVMRGKLKRSSYILWRKRVRGRLTKHRKLSKFKLYHPQE